MRSGKSTNLFNFLLTDLIALQAAEEKQRRKDETRAALATPIKKPSISEPGKPITKGPYSLREVLERADVLLHVAAMSFILSANVI